MATGWRARQGQSGVGAAARRRTEAHGRAERGGSSGLGYLERAGRLERARATPAGPGVSSAPGRLKRARTAIRGGGRGPGGTARSGCWLPLQRRRRKRCAGYGSPRRLSGAWRRWPDRRMHTRRPWRGPVYARAALLHGLPWCGAGCGKQEPECVRRREFELNVRRQSVWAQQRLLRLALVAASERPTASGARTRARPPTANCRR